MKQETSTIGTPSKQYVCISNYRNITAVHDVLQRITEDIDMSDK
jgi:hypothetical protein